MSLVYAVRSEHEKTKHTPFWVIHFCVPVIGALLFLFYYLLYRNTGDSKKLKMILELTTMVFPLLISVGRKGFTLPNATRRIKQIQDHICKIGVSLWFGDTIIILLIPVIRNWNVSFRNG